MGTVLFAYEFGAGLGHLTPLLSVARRLDPRHRLVFCLPDPKAAEGPIRRALGQRAEVRRGVLWKPATEGGSEISHTLADALWNAGFGVRTQIGEAFAAWRALLAEVRPDLIVADFAPGLRLASEGVRPMVEVGYGYTVPPPGRPMPPLRPWEREAPAESRSREFEMLSWANAVRAANGGPAVDHLADLFQGDETFVCTLAPFDMYAAHRTGPQLGPLMGPISRGPAFSERAGPELFLYMHANHPSLGDLLQAMTLTGRRGAAYVSGGLAPEAVARKCGKNVAVFRKPADYAAILPQAKVVIHHGGLGTGHAALAAGTPQFMAPTRVEWQVNARAVEGLGAGVRLYPGGTVETMAAALSALAEDAAVQSGALRAATMVRDVLRSDPLGTIAAACEWRLA